MRTQLKENTIIQTREFVRNFSAISERPASFKYMVIKHGKLVGTFTPNLPTDSHDAWWQSLETVEPPTEPHKKRLTLKDLEKYRFRSGEKNLSQQIDKIVYGIER